MHEQGFGWASRLVIGALLCVGCSEEVASPASGSPSSTIPSHVAEELPVDLETLPGMTVLWRRNVGLGRLHAGEEVILGRSRGALVALDAQTGTTRWSTPLRTGDGYPLYFDAGCGVAVAFEAMGIQGFDAVDGRPVFSMPLVEPLHRYEGRRSGGRVVGCEVVAALSTGALALPEGEDARLVRFDVRSGVLVSDDACEGCDTLRYAESDGAGGMLLDTGGEVLHLGPHGAAERMETRRCDTHQPAGSARCVQMVSADRLEAWGDGERVQWSTDLPVQDGGLQILAASASHVLLGSTNSRVVFDVDPTSGVIRWTRLRPVGWTFYVGIAGDRAYFSSVAEETVAVDLTRAEAPARDSEPLGEDLQRALIELDAPQDEYGPSRGYPTGPLEAQMWIARNRSLLEPSSLARAIETAPPARLLRLLTLLGSDEREAPRMAIVGLLPETYVARPSLEIAHLRRAIADAVGPTIALESADALADDTLGWLGWLEASMATTDATPRPGRCGRARETCELEGEVREAILASSRALERAALETGPFERVRDALDRFVGISAPACAMDDDDRALAAALSHGMALSPTTVVRLPEGHCIAVLPSSSEPFITLGESRDPSWIATGVPAWDDAEHRVYDWSWIGPHGLNGERLYLAHVGGSWRVVRRVHGLLGGPR